MSFGTFHDDDEVMSEINMTPLVDVMLVLLIIFLITMPVIQHSVKLDLPNAPNRANDVRLPHVNLSIKADGSIIWDGKPVQLEQLAGRFSETATKKPQPELHLYADKKTSYERVAQVMAAAQSGGMLKIGFVTDPNQQP